jgi:2-amino-4-hydroxy-6-hydroxymethyldihydropteridine diphosphokinase
VNATAPVRQAFIGAGANLGDRAATLAGAVARLKAWNGVLTAASSSVYATKPVGVVDQPMFLNLVIGVETTLTPEELLRALLEIEREFGRVRAGRWGPRTLDLDLLVFEGETRATPDLELPHPRMLERSFVTVPLRELLERPRFRQPCWTTLHERLGAPKNESGIALFSRESGGERS